MLLALCDICGCQAFFWAPFKVGERSFIVGSCCARTRFRVPEPLAATVTVRRADGTIGAYEVSSGKIEKGPIHAEEESTR